MTNITLSRARALKNDEFYTTLQSVENELKFYENALDNKTVLCNCNDGENSSFWKYFSANFHRLHLKKLICISYGKDAYRMEMTREQDTVKAPLNCNGDFRNDECIELLKISDIVVTNPPFSLFRTFLDLLYEYEKQFLVIGNMNMVVCNGIFPYFQNGKLQFGHTAVKSFSYPDGTVCNFGNIYWYTNIPTGKHVHRIPLHERYSPEKYPGYDNYPAIEVGRIKDIPCDYGGLMGVPITYLLKHDPELFEIIGIADGNDDLSKPYLNPIQHRWDGAVMNGSKVNDTAVIKSMNKPTCTYYTADNSDGYLVCKYKRILIKNKNIREEYRP